MNSINQYHCLPFYAWLIDNDRSCPVNSPVSKIPPFQIEFESNVSAASADLVSFTGSVGDPVYSINLDIDNVSGGPGYVTHMGDQDLGQDPGLYRVRLEVDGEIYWSHVINCAYCWNEQEFHGEISAETEGMGFLFTASFDEAPAIAHEIDIDYGSGWERLATDDGEFLYSLLTDNQAHIRFKVWIDDVLFWKEYLFEYDDENPDPETTGTLTLLGVGGENYHIYGYLEFWSDTDMPGFGALYQNEYKQRLYVEGHRNEPGVVNEEAFLTNGEGVDTLDSVAVAQVLNIEFYPIPDAAILALTSARWHNNARWVTAANVDIFTASKISVSPSPVEDAPCSRALIGLEINRTFVSCTENQTLV